MQFLFFPQRCIKLATGCFTTRNAGKPIKTKSSQLSPAKGAFQEYFSQNQGWAAFA